jgi:hypothetical protein
MKKSKIVMFIAVLAITITSCQSTSGNYEMDQDKSMVFAGKGINVESISSEIEFVHTLESLGLSVGSPIMAEPDVLTLTEAIQYSVSAVEMAELAWTFPVEKTNNMLAAYGIEGTGDEKADQLNAVAVSIGLFDSVWYLENAADGELSNRDIEYLLTSVIDFKGITEDYLGKISDDSIYSSILDSWNNYSIVQNNNLVNIVDEGVIQGITTGYNVVKIDENSNFDPELTITYGHSDIKHAIQLVGLIHSEGLDAKVDFQGKTSAFLYLQEWGTPTESESFKVKQIPNGNYVAYSKEYNLYFEFMNKEEKADFNKVILAYAKKDSADEPGLIYGSWWQPLYSSATEMGDGYVTITDNVISSGEYEAHPFSLNENVENAVTGFKNIDNTLEINSKMFWVNQAFYNYLIGDFK